MLKRRRLGKLTHYQNGHRLDTAPEPRRRAGRAWTVSVDGTAVAEGVPTRAEAEAMALGPADTGP